MHRKAIQPVQLFLDRREYRRASFDKETGNIVLSNVLFLIVALLAFIFFMIIGIAWSYCIALRWTLRHTVIGGYRLRFDGNSFQLFGNCLKWFFLCIITLGIYSFWAPIKYKEWEVRHTKIAELVDGAPMQQTTPNVICPPVYVQPSMSYPYAPHTFNGCPYEQQKSNKKK